MSYILDAIKKSEAARNQGVSPGALAHPTPVSRTARPLRIATVLIAVNVAVLGSWWWWQGQTTATVASPSTRPAVTREQRSPAPEAAPRTIEQPETSVRAASTATLPEPPVQLPEFSTHVFAEDPQLRAVTLDGRRLTEGDLISQGVRLLEITENGVVLELNGERIEFDVLQDWRS